MATRASYPWLTPAVEDSALVLASSRRLARELRAAYDEQQRRAGREVWVTPDILYWQDWLARSLAEAGQAGLGRLLGTAASSLLWEQALEHSGGQAVLSTAGIVQHARRAWQRLHDWQLTLEDAAHYAASRDEHWFLRAARSYAERLQANGWLDAAQSTACCAALCARGELQLPRRVVHAGFDRLTPALSALLAGIAGQGVTVDAAPLPAADGRQSLHAYPDDAAQWRAAGHWARGILAQRPDARIAVVAPDLEVDAARITRLVREGFAPGWQLAGARYRASVDVSYGRPLTAFPLIGMARLCLRFCSAGLRSSEVSLLLRSTFLGDDDLDGRARLEMRLRRLPERSWGPAELLAALGGPRNADDGAGWRARLQAAADLHRDAPGRQTPAAWARHVDGLLAAFGWPGRSSPDSDEFQLQNRWRQLLNEFAQLEAVRANMTFAEAQQRLFQVAADSVYQPEVPVGGLRLMGMLETAGLEFDAVWLGRLDAGRWPAPGQPLALLNRQLQREHGMPDATPADALEFAQRVLARLRAASDEVLVSWALADGDEEQVASPLLELPAGPLAATRADPGWHAAQHLGTASLQPLSDDTVPAVAAGERVRGGAYTVQRMQEEPFDAFARGRLGVAEFESFQPGLTVRLRGNVLHHALQLLLADCPSQQQILDWDIDTCRQRIEQSAWRALRELQAQADDVLREVLKLEKLRLTQLLRNFLQAESEREPFRVEALEAERMLNHGAVRLELRIDRIDRLADDSLLILDYKSGSKKPFMNTKTGCPANLQLCVYADAADDAIGGLALVNIDSREIAYSGEGSAIPWGRIKADDWPARLAAWRATVQQLLARFAAGEAGVNVQQSADDARALALLSRVEELRRGH